MRYSTVIVGIVMLATACSTTTSTLQPQAGAEQAAVASRFYAKAKAELLTSIEATARQLGWNVREVNVEAGVILAKAPMSIWTWGDTVTIVASAHESGKVRVDLVSTSPQKLDWGKNQENIEKFYAALDAHLKTQ